MTSFKNFAFESGTGATLSFSPAAAARLVIVFAAALIVTDD